MKKRVKFLIPFFVLGSVAAGYVMFVAGKEVYRGRKIEQEIDKLNLEALKIEKDNNQLREKIEYLDTDQFREKVAKEKLNLKKEGELVMEVRPSVTPKEETEEPAENLSEENNSEEQQSNFSKWWKKFFSY